jgi:hypothetical protein
VTFVPIQTGAVFQLGTKRIEVLPALHTVPAVGYGVSGAQARRRAGCSLATPVPTRRSGSGSARYP